jgi:hypothetical protein
MMITSPATPPESIEPRTGLPRGAMVCLACAVSWNPFASLTCWHCGLRGVSTALAAATAEAAS